MRNFLFLIGIISSILNLTHIEQARASGGTHAVLYCTLKEGADVGQNDSQYDFNAPWNGRNVVLVETPNYSLRYEIWRNFDSHLQSLFFTEKTTGKSFNLENINLGNGSGIHLEIKNSENQLVALNCGLDA